jgi:hypothetical protein
MRRLAMPKNGIEDFDRTENLAEVSCSRLASIAKDKQLVGFGRKAVKQSMDGLA